MSGGDPGVFAMAAAVCEAIERGPDAWRALDDDPEQREREAAAERDAESARRLAGVAGDEALAARRVAEEASAEADELRWIYGAPLHACRFTRADRPRGAAAPRRRGRRAQRPPPRRAARGRATGQRADPSECDGPPRAHADRAGGLGDDRRRAAHAQGHRPAAVGQAQQPRLDDRRGAHRDGSAEVPDRPARTVRKHHAGRGLYALSLPPRGVWRTEERRCRRHGRS